MKKILIFSIAYYPSHVSGAEAAVKEITERINDIEFHLITLRFDSTTAVVELMGNVLVHRVGSGSYLGKMLFPLTAALKARSLHHQYKYDALWALMTYMLFPTMLAKIFGMRAPHILTLQDGDSYEKVFGRLRIRPFMWLINKGFRTAAVVQAISNYLATWPKQRGSNAPVEIVRNGANPKDLKESFDPAMVEAVRQKWGKQEGDVWLVNTSRLEHQKAQDSVIRALPLLSDTVKFLVVGGGQDEQMLKDLVKELGLAQRVMFAGQVTRDEVTAYRKASDIFVANSRSEGLGNAFLSALASRLPLITTGVGGIADYAKDNETAWIVPVDDPAALAEKVKEILANPQKVKEISERARRMVEEYYDWDKIAVQMREKVFARIVGK
jgi:glycosyltransferase involved in cell wall biosynthesis